MTIRLYFFREQQKNELDIEDGFTNQTNKMKPTRGSSARAGSARRKNSFDYFNAVQMLGKLNSFYVIGQVSLSLINFHSPCPFICLINHSANDNLVSGIKILTSLAYK